MTKNVHFLFCPNRCAMFWNDWEIKFKIFSFWDMVDFVLKILIKLTKMSPYMIKLLSFAPNLAKTFFFFTFLWKEKFRFFFHYVQILLCHLSLQERLSFKIWTFKKSYEKMFSTVRYTNNFVKNIAQSARKK